MVKLSVYRGSMFFLISSSIMSLVGGLEHLDYFSHHIGVMSSQLTFTPSFFRGVGQLPTRSLCHYVWQCTSNQMLRFLVTPPSSCLRKPTNYTHMLHLWYIYLQNWMIFMVYLPTWSIWDRVAVVLSPRISRSSFNL